MQKSRFSFIVPSWAGTVSRPSLPLHPVMKKALLIGILLLHSCQEKNEPAEIQPTQRQVLTLQVDYQNLVFEGAVERNYPPTPGFTITADYQAPGDFGGIQLYFSELNELLFDGTIIWMGRGSISHPVFKDPADFPRRTQAVPMPAQSRFQTVSYHPAAYYPDTIPYQGLWQAIEHLEAVADWQVSGQGTIDLFLYTPSVGAGNPADWDWIVFLSS